MAFLTFAFAWLATAVGVLVLFSVVLWAGGLALVAWLKLLRSWHGLLLVVARQLKGKAYRDQLFWEAIKEHIGKSKFAAEAVAKFAYRCQPYEKDEPL